MPNQNGRGMGRGLGRGRGNQNVGRQQNGQGRNAQTTGVSECVCPKCGHTEVHQRGVPCTQVKCPKCETLMQGTFCKE